MKLQLELPPLNKQRVIHAHTTSAEIENFLADLPLTTPYDAGTSLVQELELLNTQKVAVNTRFYALEQYLPYVHNLHSLLDKHYFNERIPHNEKSQQYADLVKSLYEALSTGYKRTVLEAMSLQISLRTQSTQALFIQRALHSLHQVAFVCYQCYKTIPDTLWVEINRLFHHAYQSGLHLILLNEHHKSEKNNNILSTYLQTCLLHLANPQNLSPINIKLATQYLAKNIQLTEVMPMSDYLARHPKAQDTTDTEEPHLAPSYFILPIHTEKAPSSMRRTTDGHAEDLVLSCRLLVEQIKQDISYLKQKETQPSQDIKVMDTRHIGLLYYLARHWSGFPKRRYNRVKRLDAMEINVGISQIHYYLGEHTASNHTVSPAPSLFDEEASTPVPIAPSTRWISYNVSACGVALRRPSNVDEQVRIGDLIAMREVGKRNWSLASIKWIMQNKNHQLDIGLQLIAPNARAQKARKLTHSHFEDILMLAGVPVLQEPASLITHAGLYHPGNNLELIENNRAVKVMITKRIERTGSYERFGFQYLEDAHT